jgi:hypothetical protein
VVLQACLPLAFQALLLQATRSKERQAFFKILAVMPSLVQPLQQTLFKLFQVHLPTLSLSTQ